MTPISAALWPEVSRLLDQALDLPVAERPTWLERLSRDQPDLATAVQELLAAHARSETGDFLDRGPRAAIGEGTDDGDDADPSQALQAGDAIGPYRLLRPLGSGGMAVVWLAERHDGALTREVALKLPQHFVWRPGLAERFARERDILARLEHPHIARLYDAGLSAADGPGAGLPYLVLEYVQGRHLTDYCNTHRLTTAQRLALVMQVLDAVQYAHTRLVIHRDLKPANILVTDNGQVQLLDFGVAKLLADAHADVADAADSTQLTQRAGRAFTPDYASPEQVRGETLGTASDVYSLGVVLYELLCGQRPYQLKHTSMAQLEQAIVDVEPAAPSSRITEADAALRGSTVRRLQRELRGELDTIVLKALKKQPEQRYATVAALAEDLRRHCDGEPVLARPESRVYRLSKFAVRHRLAVGATSVVVVALVAASGVSLWQARLAQRQAQRALAAQAFLTDIFRTNSDAQSDPMKARQTTARELLDIGARRIDQNLQADPEGRSDVLALLGDMYYDLGLDAQAADLFGRRVVAAKQAFGPRDRRVAQALALYGKQLDQLGRDAEQQQVLEEARAILDALGDDRSEQRAQLLDAMATAQAHSGTKAVELARQAVAIYRQRYPLSEAFPQVLTRLGTALWRIDDLVGAEAAFSEALALLEHRPDASVSAIVTASLTLANTQARLQKLVLAEATYRRVLATTLQRNGAQHVDTLHVQAWFGSFLHRTGRRPEAWQLLEAADATVRQGGITPHATRAVKSHFTQALLAEGRYDEAAPLVDWLVTEYRGVAGGNNPIVVACLRLQADQRLGQGRRADAERSIAEAWQRLDNGLSAEQRKTVVNGVALVAARIALARGEAEPALQALARVDERGVVAGLPLWPEAVRAKALRAEALLLLQRTAEARATAQGALDEVLASGLQDRYAALEADVLLPLGRALQREGQPEAACQAFDRAARLRVAALGERSPYVTEAERARADCRPATANAVKPPGTPARSPGRPAG